MLFHSGEKPGIGTYICTKDRKIVIVKDMTDKLPRCPECKNTYYRKII
jgi:hypothetical protein